jgi:lipoprotein-anchoring transpeptidase ErfK/SrfK
MKSFAPEISRRRLLQLLGASLVPGAWGAVEARTQAPAGSKAVPQPKDFESLLRVQLFLDGAMFAPGKIDGKQGEFTRKAVAAWNTAQGYDEPENWAGVLQAAAVKAAPLFAVYRLREVDFAQIMPDLPAKAPEQSLVTWLGYRSVAESLAERYHTTEACLAALNSKAKLSDLKPGQALRVPNVDQPFDLSRVKASGFGRDRLLSRRQVLVDTTEKTAAFYDVEGRLCAFFPITRGRPDTLHFGPFDIEEMVSLPPFRWDEQLLKTGVRGAEAFHLPPGPNSPVGVLWAGLKGKPIGLHGTASPETIGRSESSGCIRFANWDAIRLPQLLRPGARVTIR